MKPNFALSLSFEGIKLLHRAAGGWREVGEVPVAADDLAGELAMLRKTAAGLEPGGVRSKLIIPSSQIKYLTIETIGLSDDARRQEAEAALENATPYDVADLVYDISLDGAKTHVAAVARETLAEAEAFATEHRFHPVSFVAVPEDAPYLGEPFFGVTDGVDALLEPGEEVEPDGIAVVVVGAIATEPEPEAEPDTQTAPQKPEAEHVPEPAPTITPAPEKNPDPKPETAPPVAPTPAKAAEPEKVAEPEAATLKPETTPKGEAVDSAVAKPVPTDDPKQDSKPVAKAASVPAQDPSTEQKQPELKKPEPAATVSATDQRAAPKVSIAKKPPESEKSAPVIAATTTQPKKTSFDISPQAAPSSDQASGFSSRRTGVAKPLGGAQRIVVPTPKPDSSSLTKPAAAVDSPEPKPAKTGFLSRRKPRKGAAAATPAPVASVPQTGTEAERMTIFGARSDQVGGKPRFLGLIMTVILLVFLAGVAAWAAVFLDNGLAGLIKSDEQRTIASAPENQIDPEIIRTPDGLENGSSPSGENVQVAALDPVLSAEDTAILDAMQDAQTEPQRPVITEQEAAARYAVSGIWPLAPTTPLSLPEAAVESVYYSSVDPVSTASDALALPAPDIFDTDVQMAALVSPPPFGQRTSLNAAGLITPTPEGVVAPGGYTLIAASPPRKPPAAIVRSEAQPAVAVAAAAPSPLLKFRPKNRPLGLAERTERAQLGGVTRLELAGFRPSLRPRSIQDRARQAEEAAKAAEEARLEASAAAATAAAAAALALPPQTTAAAASPIQNATRFATSQSKRPDTRPRNFDRIVKRAQRAAPAATETRVAAAASVAPRTVAPSIPSKTSVARSATVKNAINLRKVNLIGVYGKPSSRRALVRLSNGRYQKVKVGDRIDGGRVAAISTSELRYTKGGRNVVLKMP